MKFISSSPKTNLISRLFSKLENSLPSINQTPTVTSRHCTIFLTDETVFYLKGERFQRIKWCLILLTSVKKRANPQDSLRPHHRIHLQKVARRPETKKRLSDSLNHSGKTDIKSGTTINNGSPASKASLPVGRQARGGQCEPLW